MSDSPLYEWIALCRIRDGGVAKSAGLYFDRGQPVPNHLTTVFDRLTWSGLVTVADGDPIWGLRRLSLTTAGQARYTRLCEQRRQASLPVPPAEFDSRTCPRIPAGRRSSAAPLASPDSRPDLA